MDLFLALAGELVSSYGATHPNSSFLDISSSNDEEERTSHQVHRRSMSPVYSSPLRLTPPPSNSVSLFPPFTPPLPGSILSIYITDSCRANSTGPRSEEVTTARSPQAGPSRVRETGSRSRAETNARSPQAGPSRARETGSRSRAYPGSRSRMVETGSQRELVNILIYNSIIKK